MGLSINCLKMQVCNNNGCERDEDGRLCSGCGICECGKCKCDKCKGCGIDPGPDCKCSLCKCRKSPNDKICSGIGHCECDKCICPPPYTGNLMFFISSNHLFELCFVFQFDALLHLVFHLYN